MEESAGHSDQPLDELIRLLGDPEPNVRADARRQLCTRAEEAIPGLVAALDTVYEETRFEISKALTEMGEVVVEPMMKAILHPNIHVRAAAARVLSLIGGEDARRRLEEASRAEGRKTVRKELREAAAKITRRLETAEIETGTHPPPDSGELVDEKELSPKEREEKRLYFNIARNLIVLNWARPQLFPREAEGVEVLVTLKVETDGSVSRVLIENRWQNTPLGESLREAIRRSSPLPPVPEGLSHGKGEIDLTFILRAPI